MIKYLDECKLNIHTSNHQQSLKDGPPLTQLPCFYIIDAIWLDQWKAFIFDDNVKYLPPGHITNNENLLYFRVASKKHLKLIETAEARGSHHSNQHSQGRSDNVSNMFSFGSWNRFALGCDESGKLTIKVFMFLFSKLCLQKRLIQKSNKNIPHLSSFFLINF